jgi:hypothetical protein
MGNECTSGRKGSPALPPLHVANVGNTCYIDSVLFAMFSTSSKFDYLLDLTFPSASDCHPRRMLQAALRERFVLRLRRHECVSEDDMLWLRDCCRVAGCAVLRCSCAPQAVRIMMPL